MMLSGVAEPYANLMQPVHTDDLPVDRLVELLQGTISAPILLQASLADIVLGAAPKIMVEHRDGWPGWQG